MLKKHWLATAWGKLLFYGFHVLSAVITAVLLVASALQALDKGGAKLYGVPLYFIFWVLVTFLFVRKSARPVLNFFLGLLVYGGSFVFLMTVGLRLISKLSFAP